MAPSSHQSIQPATPTHLSTTDTPLHARAHHPPTPTHPRRRRRTYSTSLGVYAEHCGLRNVYMSWGAPEYLYMMLVLNQTALPEEALFMIRCAAGLRGAGRLLGLVCV